MPSIGGLSIYLCDDGDGNLGPRVGDAAWSALWNRFFDEAADELYQDITSPLSMPRPAIDQERRFSGTSSSEVQSPFADQSNGLRREADNYDESYLNDQRRPSSSLRRTFASGNSAASPMAYHTPSPRHPKFQRSASHTSQRVTPLGTQARLPIVGRIEWAVDKNRAPWWSNWIGEADVSSERSVSSVVTSQIGAGSARKGPPRRSMHLTSSLPHLQTESSVRGTPTPAGKTHATQQDDIARDREHAPLGQTAIGIEDRETSATSSPQESNLDLQRMGYEPIEDQEERALPPSKTEKQCLDNDLKVNGLPGHAQNDDQSASYETQSYAGYSALLGVDDETRAQDRASSREERDEPMFQTRPLRLAGAIKASPRARSQHFNANALGESDDLQWKELQQQDVGEMRTNPPDSLSARYLGEQKELSAVHEWIAKTQSPQSRGAAVLDLSEDEEGALLPPQDDVEEVLGLWAEKARDVHTVESPTVMQSNRSSLASTSKTGPSRLPSNHRNSSRISSASSKRSPSASPHNKQSPLLHGMARMADLPEETTSSLLDSQPPIGKVSLLSPIALDKSPATFAGPSAKLGSLLGTSRSTLGPPDEQAYSYTRQGTADSLTMPSSDADVYSRNNTLSSPRLELPSPRSPGAVSRGSSSTEASDTLLDMERALALLSPAVSHNHQESPALGTSTADSTYDSGVLTSAVRVKMPLVSSKESMAKAKTLSTSVTPSPRWFRNTTPAAPRLSQSTSHQQLSQVLPVTGSSQDAVAKASPRPASASPSAKQQDRLASWTYPSPTSTAPMEASKAGQVQHNGLVDEVVLAKRTTEHISQRAQEVEDKTGELHSKSEDYEEEEADAAVSERGSKGGRDDVDVSALIIASPVTSAAGTRVSSVRQRDSVQIYDSPIEDDERRNHHWLQAGEHLGRQGWSDTTGEASRVLTMGDSTMHEDENIDNDAIFENNLAPAPSAARFAPAINATFSPRSGQYATVGVQAERDNISRTDSVFSLVSDEALGSEASRLMEGQEDGESGEEAEDQEVQEEVSKARPAKPDTLQTPIMESASTPQMGGRPRMGHSGNSSVDFHPSFQRMIRGNSFAESSEASSTNVNSPYMDREAQLQGPGSMQNLDWSTFDVKPAKAEVGAAAADVTVQQQEIKTVNEEGAKTKDATPHECSTSYDEDEWSQSGSDFGDDATSASPATRLSGNSQQNATGLSDAGGRTPTFFYDSHLTDEGSSSRRASGARRSSGSRKSLRLSRVPVRSVNVHDALGVGLLSAGTATVSSEADHSNRLSVLDDGIGDLSVDSNRHDIVSLAGETLEGHVDSMLQGFEHVSPPQRTQELRDTDIAENVRERDSSAPSRSEDMATLQTLSNFSFANGAEQQSPAASSARIDKVFPSSRRGTSIASPRLNRRNLGVSLRRSLGSMGSIHDGRIEEASQGRRASASATSPGSSFSSQSPRRFKGAMLRLGAAVSPNQRFRALPPSPNLPPKKMSGVGDPMSPIGSSFQANGMPHTNRMASPPTTFSSMDSLAMIDGLQSSDSTERPAMASPRSPLT